MFEDFNVALNQMLTCRERAYVVELRLAERRDRATRLQEILTGGDRVLGVSTKGGQYYGAVFEIEHKDERDKKAIIDDQRRDNASDGATSAL
jgi:hypothetical protein